MTCLVWSTVDCTMFTDHIGLHGSLHANTYRCELITRRNLKLSRNKRIGAIKQKYIQYTFIHVSVNKNDIITYHTERNVLLGIMSPLCWPSLIYAEWSTSSQRFRMSWQNMALTPMGIPPKENIQLSCWLSSNWPQNIYMCSIIVCRNDHTPAWCDMTSNAYMSKFAASLKKNDDRSYSFGLPARLAY